MTLMSTHGKFQVIDSGKTGGIYSVVETLEGQNHARHIGNFQNLETATRVAQSMDIADKAATVEAPVVPETKGFELFGYTFSFTKK
jgi:hypothetical protein